MNKLTFADEQDQEEKLQLLAAWYLRKGYTPEAILAAMQRAIEKAQK